MRKTLLLTLSLLSSQAFAADNTWQGQGNPALHQYSDINNWAINTTVPGNSQTATFPNGPMAPDLIVDIDSAAPASVAAFDVLDPGFMITNNRPGGFSFTGGGITGGVPFDFSNTQQLDFNNTAGANQAILNNSATLRFNNMSSAQSSLIHNNNGITEFNNDSTANNATITNANGSVTFKNDATGGTGASANTGTGAINFNNASNAQTRNITNSGTGSVNFNNAANAGNGGTITNSGTGNVNFNSTSNAVFSTAGNKTIDNTGTGNIQFLGFSVAGTSTINNSGTGTVSFNGSSSALNSAITNSGILNIQGSSNAGTAMITNNNNANTTFSNNASASMATIVNNGASQLTFNNDSTAGGSTITHNSTNIISFNNSAKAGTAGITLANGFMNFNNTSSAESATINNAGGTLSFTAMSTAGNANITNAAGNVIGFSGPSNAGTATITNSGIFRFVDTSQATNATINHNGGTLSIFNGPRTLMVGSLRGTMGVVQPDGANATISIGHKGLDDIFNGRFDNSLPHILSLTKTGSGTQTLTNVMNTYTGDTTIQQGTLQWDGDHANPNTSDFIIFPGATLSGVGTVRGLTTNDGCVSPGNPADPFGQLSLTTYDPASLGTFKFNVTPTEQASPSTPGGFSNCSSIGVPNPIDLTNTSAQFQIADGLYNNFQCILIENAAGTFVTQFAGISGIPMTLNAAILYGQNVDLFLTQKPTEEVLNKFFSGGNADQQSLALALNEIVSGGFADDSTEFIELFTFFNGLGDGDARFLLALDSIGSDSFNSLPFADFYATLQALDTVDGWSGPGGNFDLAAPFAPRTPSYLPRNGIVARAFAQARDHNPHFALRNRDSNFTEAALRLKSHAGTQTRDHVRNTIKGNTGTGHLWFQGFGGRSSANKTTDDLGYHATSAGVLLGVEYQMSDDLRLGAAGGYAHSNLDIVGDLAHSDIKSPIASLWGEYDMDCYNFDFGLTYRHNEYKTKRGMNFLPSMFSARGKHDGYNIMPYLRVSYEASSSPDLTVTPFIGFEYFYSHEDAFKETNLVNLGLDVKARNSSFLHSRIGAGFERTLCLYSGQFKPYFEFSYKHRATLRKPRTVATFLGTTATFTSTGSDKHLHRFDMKTEIRYVHETGATFKLGYHGDYGERDFAHAAYISMGKSW